MEDTKPWYLSRTIWASLVAAAGGLAGLAGMPVDPLEQASMAELAVQAVTAVAGIIAIIGRLFATSVATIRGGYGE
jgi:hypothetical protein